MLSFTTKNFDRYFYEYQKQDGKIVITSIYDRQHHKLISPHASLTSEIIAYLKYLGGQK